jgi:hypothetical protein
MEQRHSGVFIRYVELPLEPAAGSLGWTKTSVAAVATF